MSPFPLRLALACSLIAVLPAGRAAAERPGTTVPCTTAQASFDNAQLRCEIVPAPTAQVLRLHVVFEGVHDDSRAVLAAALDGQPVACAEGSRDRFEGDAGGDALSCRFTVPTGTAARQLRVQLVWHHAQPVAFALQRD
ncbi:MULTISPECIES: hypothetical protein [Ramlibacter]|uniref:Uncharacterized protein n=1 Tax=Ramlibacter pinisoli TaxID=2682844 RepID=A0A6N8IXD5_9BURK|nr:MULTISPECIES: hypothetical protein [Ramlibacter]MBA2961726.1 hypothetical protein [Ramlibacter sp. CGMCC 1.13660]MVQ31669.1 hypothetical protein [Ramlibacter pinisoli]